MRKIALVAVIALLAGSSCSLFERDDELSEMTLERRGETGVVRVVHEGETFEVDDRRRVEPGDVIKTSKGAQARLRLEGDREVWLANQTTVEVIDTDAVGDKGGTVLADVDDPTTVMFGDIEASTAHGVFRIDRLTAAARAGVYEGSVSLDAPGQPRVQVDSYFQAPVAAETIGTVTPYRLATSDEWDRLWLEEIVALDDQLRQLADGFSSQIGRARPNLSFFQGLSGVGNVGVVKSYLDRRPADLLIAFTIADTDDARPFKKSFSRAFALRDDGAAWGLAVAILEVRSRAMVARLERLIIGTGAVAGGAGDEFSFVATGGAGGGPGPGPSSEADGSGSPPADDDSGAPDPPGGDGGGGDGGGGDGDGGDGGGDGGDCQDIVDCTLQDPPLPLPDPSPGDSIVDDLLP
jgi:hypothetical protein